MGLRNDITLNPVGIVHREGDVQIISICPEFTDGLLRIGEAHRLQILYWMHRLDEDDRDILQCHPRADASRLLRGVFALRSPMRPNPIGSTVVNLQDVRDGSLVVTGLDAEEGSPVIDIKISS